MDIKGEPGPILVTGASSGIGRTITEFLSAQGNTVFAGARKEIDLRALNQLPNVTALKLDVTSDRDVKEVVNWLHHEGKSVYGLVNNAGVSIVGPLIDQTVEDLDRSINVHLYGVHRMTCALAEFMIESKGRIVNISSISGFLTWKFGGPYVISKHALEAYSDTLREELAQFGVKVITVEPGNFRSNIDINWANSILPLKKDVFLNQSRYSEEFSKLVSEWSSPEILRNNPYPEPQPVAEAVSQALFSETPKPRYVVGGGDKFSVRVVDKILETLRQVNQGMTGSYQSFSREEIVERLKTFLN